VIKQDIRDQIFCGVRHRRFLAQISARGNGIFSGAPWLRKACRRLGLRLIKCKESGEKVKTSDRIALVEGNAKQIARGEEELIGWISKSSGIATAARKAKTTAGKKLRVVSGAWKKMPPPLKELIRHAVADGGIPFRISERPFIYLDKNYVKMLGGVEAALSAVKDLDPCIKVVQLKSRGRRLLQEAAVAAKRGADILMIDTGRMEDVKRVDRELRGQGLRAKVRLAFAGEIAIEDLVILRKMPVDIVDIGKSIVDAPLLDMKMDVVRNKARG
jgi:nicotinate-nucleotide pyrophosphorylase (carboxylating)